MTEVITFFFDLCTDLLSVISKYWILSVFFLITILSWVIGLINQSKGNNR